MTLRFPTPSGAPEKDFVVRYTKETGQNKFLGLGTPGIYVLTAEKTGYVPYKKLIEIKEGDGSYPSHFVEITMEPLSQSPRKLPVSEPIYCPQNTLCPSPTPVSR